MDAITAQTLSKKLDDVERIDRMIANAEARRHVVLREISRSCRPLGAAAEALEKAELRPAAAGEAGVTELPPPVFLEGEDDQLYARLFGQVKTAISPGDIIEEFWGRDDMDLQWEVIRFRRLKACLLNAHAAPKITDILSR